MTAETEHATQASNGVMVGEAAAPLDAGGTMWRLRSLVAMGHDAARIAQALRLQPWLIERLLDSEAPAVSSELHDLACQLWDAWWDKHPPERTRDERKAAETARRLAERFGWCTPLGLDEDELDEPGYRPYTRYRVARGTGQAGDFCRGATRTGEGAA